MRLPSFPSLNRAVDLAESKIKTLEDQNTAVEYYSNPANAAWNMGGGEGAGGRSLTIEAICKVKGYEYEEAVKLDMLEQRLERLEKLIERLEQLAAKE